MRIAPVMLAAALAFSGHALADKDKDESGKRAEKDAKELEKEWERAKKDTEKAREREEKQREKARESVEKQREKDRDREDKRREKERERSEKGGDKQGDSYFHRNGYDRLSIPKGHYPPPGECRAWYPDRPAGHQPPPQKCGAPVPAGAWLIEHPRNNQGRVRVTAYDTGPTRRTTPPPPEPVVQSTPSRPPWPGPVYPAPPPPPGPVVYPSRPVRVGPPILAVGEFDIANGVLIRVVVTP